MYSRRLLSVTTAIVLGSGEGAQIRAVASMKQHSQTNFSYISGPITFALILTLMMRFTTLLYRVD
jgi:hypothetical protein